MNFAKQREYALTHSRERYFYRKAKFKGFKEKIEHNIFWLLHNCIAHFILGIYVSKYTLKFHDSTSLLLSKPIKELKQYYINKSSFPDLNHKFRWFLHNSIVHFFLGLFPCKFMFNIHDKTARWMDEYDWV